MSLYVNALPGRVSNMSANLKDALMGGPGLDGYAFRADVYCVDCGRKAIREVFAELPNGEIDDLLFQDSETVPQPIFFGEADCAQHCGDCGEYLYGTEESED